MSRFNLNPLFNKYCSYNSQLHGYSRYTQDDLNKMSAQISAYASILADVDQQIANANAILKNLVDTYGKCNCGGSSYCDCPQPNGQVLKPNTSDVMKAREQITNTQNNINAANIKRKSVAETLESLRKAYDVAVGQYIKEREASLSPTDKLKLEEERNRNQAELAKIQAQGQSNMLLYAGIGIGLAALIAIAGYFYVKSKKGGKAAA